MTVKLYLDSEIDGKVVDTSVFEYDGRAETIDALNYMFPPNRGYKAQKNGFNSWEVTNGGDMTTLVLIDEGETDNE